MKVLVAINGSVISESMVLYALRYAKQLGYALELFHLRNAKDDLKSVEKTFAHIQTLAKAQDIEFQTLLFDSSLEDELREYVKKESVDIIFCSTRREKKLFEDSFSHKLLELNLDVDLAIVRIVKLVDINTLSSMMLSIKQERLSVRKFTFFATLASSYEAQGQIYSVSQLSKFKFARLDMHQTRQKLQATNHQLRHYLKLSSFMPFELIIKHDFSDDEVQSILYNIVKTESDLVVVGAKRLVEPAFFFGQRPLERLLQETSVNVIAFYTKED
ncbi:MAG: universal stress protein [Helicobacteraceae bacterium]|nr:universal stress protein [Helicobacteraceae bacterium]